MQSSLQSLLQSLSYAVGLLIWQPQLFIILMGGSVLTVSGALVLYLSIIGAREWLEQQYRQQRHYQPMQTSDIEEEVITSFQPSGAD